MSDLFTRDYQIRLLVHLVLDGKFYKETEAVLRLDDFDLLPCRLIYEALRKYYQLMGGAMIVPSFATLQTHVLSMIQNADGQTRTMLPPEQFEALAFVMQTIAGTRSADLNSAYLKVRLTEFLQTTRASRMMQQYSPQMYEGRAAAEFVASIVKMNDELKRVSANASSKPEPIDDNPELEKTKTHRPVSTGLSRLNAAIGGGLPMGQAGMVTACTGVGKTTALINFMIGAINDGVRCLFITLELAKYRIKHRYQSMMAMVNASVFKLDYDEWPADQKERYRRVYNRAVNPFWNYAHISDMSERGYTIADIEGAVVDWLEQNEQQGTLSQCGTVFVDWLDKINPEGLNVSRNSRDDMPLIKLAEALAELGRRHKVGMWFATQATRDAEGKDQVMLNQTAGGYHKNDPLDLSLGLAPAHDASAKREARKQEAQNEMLDDDHETLPVCSRKLNLTINKGRDVTTGQKITIYQGATLRFWNNQDEAAAAESIVEKGGPIAALHEHIAKAGRKPGYGKRRQP